VGRHHCWAAGSLGLGLSLYILYPIYYQYNNSASFYNPEQNLLPITCDDIHCNIKEGSSILRDLYRKASPRS
jgi:hypothetical protein